MQIKYHSDPFFHITIENSFSDSNLLEIKKEINCLDPQLKSGDLTGAALHNITGDSQKQNTGIFLSDCENYDNLNIVKSTNYIIRDVSKINWENKTFYRMYLDCLWGSHLLNKYRKNDYYKPHFDHSLFSMITFLYDEFNEKHGGDLYFPEYDYLHKCKDNQTILFLSREIHGVTPFKPDKDLFRYSIVTFSKLFDNKQNKKTKMSYN